MQNNVDNFSPLLVIFFLIALVRQSLFWLRLWQIKEYRFDRLWVHITETKQGKNIIVNKLNIIRLVQFTLLLLFSSIFPAVFIVVYLWFFAISVKTIVDIVYKRQKYPVFTAKTIAINFLSTFLSFFFLLTFSKEIYLVMLLVEGLQGIIVSFFIAAFSVPSRLYKEYLVKKATEKIKSFPNLMVIGIAGDYGKGSTKEYISTILSTKKKVLRSFETHNTTIGIANMILNHLDSKTQIFVVEMGAYKLGEVKEIADMVSPTIGIITPIDDQHLSLYGSEENNIRSAKELVDALPSSGFAIFNGNNDKSLALYREEKGKKILCFISDEKSSSMQADIEARNVHIDRLSLSFEVTTNKKPYGTFTAHLLGKHNIENILPGIFLGHHLGIPMDDIKKAVQEIPYWKKTMEPYKSSTGTILVDDTHNASPGSVIAALDYMKIYPGKKVLVLQPMIELGKNAWKDHERVGKKIGQICDTVVLTNSEFLEPIKKGIFSTSKKTEIIIGDHEKVKKLIDPLGENDVVVFEGRESIHYLKLLSIRKV